MGCGLPVTWQVRSLLQQMPVDSSFSPCGQQMNLMVFISYCAPQGQQTPLVTVPSGLVHVKQGLSQQPGTFAGSWLMSLHTLSCLTQRHMS
jgi:hypothetical protein